MSPPLPDAADDQGEAIAPSSARSRWHSLLGMSLMLAGATFLGWVLFRSGNELATLSWQLSVSGALACFTFLLLYLGAMPLMWQRLLGDFHHRISYRDSFAIYYVSALAKYLPGKVWGLVGIAHYARRLGLSPGVTVSSTLIQHAVVCAGSILVFGASLLLWPNAGWAHRLVAGGSWLVGGLVLLSPLPKRILALVADRLPWQRVPPRFTRRAIIAALLYYLVSVVPFALGYYYLLQSFYPTPITDVWIFTGIYLISWLAGFVTVVTPSGLGVRDGVQASLLSFFVPPPIAVTIALVQRAWLTVGDLLTGVISLWLLRRLR